VNPRLSADAVRGVYAIMPTPAVEGAEDPATTDTVDYAETARAVGKLIDDQVDAILTNGTFGEGATLTWDEHRRFAEVVVREAAGRVPVFIGATTLNTRDTVARARAIRDLGADGLLLGRPMWSYCDDIDLVRFYESVARAVPELAIIVYDNPEAFKGKISSAAYEAVSHIPQVVAAKYPGLGETFYRDLDAVGGRMRLLPVDRDWCAAWEKAPEQVVACWSGSASCGPQALVQMARRIRDGDLDGARRISGELRRASDGFFPDGTFALFAQYNIQLEKARINEAGYLRAGPCRPPYIHCPERYAEGARESGRRFAALNAAYGAINSPG
jgi:4-(2-carboxyphenyl)-2-oxobut-3-enoate aldolase